jgi:hypothetical protein
MPTHSFYCQRYGNFTATCTCGATVKEAPLADWEKDLLDYGSKRMGYGTLVITSNSDSPARSFSNVRVDSIAFSRGYLYWEDEAGELNYFAYHGPFTWKIEYK